MTPWTIAHQAPQSIGFPRQEHWSVLPFISFSGDLPIPGIKPVTSHFSCIAGRYFSFSLQLPPRKAICINTYILKVSRCPTKKEGREKGKKLTFYVNNVHNVSSLPNKRLKLSSIQNLAIHWPGRLPNIPEDQRKMLKKVAWWDSLKERCRVILKFLWFLENGSILCS